MNSHGRGESSLFSAWFKDAWPKIDLRPKRNYGERFFQLELPAEDCTFEDVILLIPEEKNGEGWRDYAEAIIQFVEEGLSKGKRIEMSEAANLTGGMKGSQKVAAAVEVEKGTQSFWCIKLIGESACQVEPSSKASANRKKVIHLSRRNERNTGGKW